MWNATPCIQGRQMGGGGAYYPLLRYMNVQGIIILSNADNILYYYMQQLIKSNVKGHSIIFTSNNGIAKSLTIVQGKTSPTGCIKGH